MFAINLRIKWKYELSYEKLFGFGLNKGLHSMADSMEGNGKQ